MKRLIKKSELAKCAKHNFQNRTSAIVYINGEVYEGSVHTDGINQFIKSHPSVMDNVPTFEDSRPVDDLLDSEMFQVGFAHLVKKEKSIFIEESTLENVDFMTVANAIKTMYPDYAIYNDDIEVGNTYELVLN